MNQLHAHHHPALRRALIDVAGFIVWTVAIVAAFLLLQAWPHLTIASRLLCAGIAAAVCVGYATSRTGRNGRD